MKIFGIVFGVLFLVLRSKSEDHHHIEQRVLENKDNSETVDPSAALEQQLNALGPLGGPFSGTPNDVQSNLTVESTALPQAEENKTLIASQSQFNVTSLLRTNSSGSPRVQNPQYIGVVPSNSSYSNTSTNAIKVPKIFPSGTSANGTVILDCDPEKIRTLTSKLSNATENSQNGTNAENNNQAGTDTQVKYRLLNNTALEKDTKTTENGQNKTNVENKNQTGIDTEVKDLLNNTRQEVASHQQPLEPQEPAQISDQINDDTEQIENGENTEDQLRNHTKSSLDDNPELQQRYLAAILVSSLVAASVLCYAALLVWRRYLENRYGSRTMLVNEEEFDDPNDLRHFSI